QKVRANGTEPLLLSANTEQNYVATFQLMHSEGATIGTARHSAKTLSIRRTRFLADGLRERIGILNANPQPAHITLELEFEASFRDMFSVRGYRDVSMPVAVAVERREDGIVLERMGRDGVRRTTEIAVRPVPDRGHPVVRGAVRPRRAHHRVPDARVEPRSRARDAAPPRAVSGAEGRRVHRGGAGQDLPRAAARRARAARRDPAPSLLRRGRRDAALRARLRGDGEVDRGPRAVARAARRGGTRAHLVRRPVRRSRS